MHDLHITSTLWHTPRRLPGPLGQGQARWSPCVLKAALLMYAGVPPCIQTNAQLKRKRTPAAWMAGRACGMLMSNRAATGGPAPVQPLLEHVGLGHEARATRTHSG